MKDGDTSNQLERLKAMFEDIGKNMLPALKRERDLQHQIDMQVFGFADIWARWDD